MPLLACLPGACITLTTIWLMPVAPRRRSGDMGTAAAGGWRCSELAAQLLDDLLALSGRHVVEAADLDVDVAEDGADNSNKRSAPPPHAADNSKKPARTGAGRPGSRRAPRRGPGPGIPDRPQVLLLLSVTSLVRTACRACKRRTTSHLVGPRVGGFVRRSSRPGGRGSRRRCGSPAAHVPGGAFLVWPWSRMAGTCSKGPDKAEQAAATTSKRSPERPATAEHDEPVEVTSAPKRVSTTGSVRPRSGWSERRASR
jgi:hypothetical protein